MKAYIREILNEQLQATQEAEKSRPPRAVVAMNARVMRAVRAERAEAQAKLVAAPRKPVGGATTAFRSAASGNFLRRAA